MKSKQKIIITSIGIILLLIAIVGASYAYFQASIGSGSTTPVTVEAGTIDSLVFDTGNPIEIEANQTNFASGQGNRSGSTTASAILTANNQASSAVTYTYNVYLNITENTYVKTGSSAELVLRVTDPNTGNLVSIPDLTQVTVGGVTGYDITEEDGLITIASNYSISTSTTKTDTWNISVYFVNLASDQSDNAGAYFEASIQITNGNYSTTVIEDACSQGDLLRSCIVSSYTQDGDNGLYYHSVGKTTSAEDGSYRYSGDSSEVDNYVCFGTTEATCDFDHLYRIIGVIPVTLSDGTTTQNLVKLIKSDYANSDLLGTNGDYKNTTYSASSYSNYNGSHSTINRYYWNKSNPEMVNSKSVYNLWRLSQLNTINLNTNFLSTYLGNTWNSKIAEVEWQVGGAASIAIVGVNAKSIYNYEIVNPNPSDYGNNEYTYNAKVGLIYVSDYAYANSDWTILSNNETIGTSNNWIYNGLYELTITRNSTSAYNNESYIIASSGTIRSFDVRTSSANGNRAVRPVFYLNSGVTYQRGSGTISDPIRIN